MMRWLRERLRRWKARKKLYKLLNSDQPWCASYVENYLEAGYNERSKHS